MYGVSRVPYSRTGVVNHSRVCLQADAKCPLGPRTWATKPAYREVFDFFRVTKYSLLACIPCARACPADFPTNEDKRWTQSYRRPQTVDVEGEMQKCRSAAVRCTDR